VADDLRWQRCRRGVYCRRHRSGAKHAAQARWRTSSAVRRRCPWWAGVGQWPRGPSPRRTRGTERGRPESALAAKSIREGRPSTRGRRTGSACRGRAMRARALQRRRCTRSTRLCSAQCSARRAALVGGPV
jgi:hypothetical protein